MATLYLNNQLLINTIFYSTLGVFAGSTGIGGAIYAGYELSELKVKKQTPEAIEDSESETEVEVEEEEEGDPVDELYSQDSAPGASRVQEGDARVGADIYVEIPDSNNDLED